MYRATTHLQRFRKRIGSERSVALAIGATAASLLSVSYTAKNPVVVEEASPEVIQPSSKQAQLQFLDSLPPLPSFEPLLLPNYAECDSFFARWRRPKSILDSVKDKRKLKTVYHVDWESPLGEGGFGAVYLARDKKSNGKVALKKISKEFTSDQGFQREIEALLAIRQAGGHPNVLQFKENFDEEGTFYLTLDYISGGEMFDHLINSGPYSEADAARLMREVASALSFLHGIDIVHCDLKPENIMLSTPSRFDSVVKVIDFGTAQVLNKDGVPSMSNAGVGTTPAYCPPEVLKNKSETPTRNPSMDMWAVGIILYTMLIGAHPFDLRGDATDDMIAYKVINRKAPPLRGSPYTRHLSSSAIDLIEKLLSWDEEKRMTADDMLNHPWVRGVTAKRTKIDGSDNKLSKLRPIKSRLEAKVFKDFISWADDGVQDVEGSGKMSLFERSFRKFDTSAKGFITAKDVGKGLDEKVEGDEALSLTAFSTLLSENMQNFFFKKGEVVYKEGDEGKDMFFLNSGVVEVTTKDGFRTILKAGDFVGEGALLNNKKRSGTVKCITPVHAIKITKEYFSKYLSASDLNLKMLETTKSREASRSLFNGFSNILSENMKNKSFSQGDVIYKEGDKGDDMIFIKSGTVAVTNEEGFRATLKQGDFVGEGALLSKKPRSSTVTCLTDVEGMMISRDYFEKYMASSNEELRGKMYQENKNRDLARVRSILRQQKHLHPFDFSAGDLIFKEGDLTKNLYIVVDGEVDMDVGGIPAVEIKKGDLCGAHALLFERPRNASARCAARECKVVEIGPRTFRGLLEASSSLRDSLTDICLQREFQKAVVVLTKKIPKTEKEFLGAFNAIKQDRTSQVLVLDDFKKLLGKKMGDKQIKSIFEAVDLAGNGSIDFETFKVFFL